MAASYPSSIAVIATVNNTDVSDASQVNVPSAEIVAVETGLLNGFQHDILPLNDDAKSLGSTSKRWLKGWFQDVDLDGTLTMASGLGVASGGTGATTLAAHGLLIGAGTSAVVVSGAGTSAQVLTSNGAAADPTFQALPSNLLTLLKANSGTDTGAGNTNVDTVAISGLTAKDTLLVKAYGLSVTQATANFQLYNSTDSVQLYNMVNPITANNSWAATADIGQSQASATSIYTNVTGALTGGSTSGATIVSAFTQNWTGSWTLALRHSGVTGGGTLQWSWKVYKVAGQ